MHIVDCLDSDSTGCSSLKIFRVYLAGSPDAMKSTSFHVFTLDDGAEEWKAINKLWEIFNNASRVCNSRVCNILEATIQGHLIKELVYQDFKSISEPVKIFVTVLLVIFQELFKFKRSKRSSILLPKIVWETNW